MTNYGNDAFVGTVGNALPVDVVVNGVTYRNQQGEVYRVQGNQFIPITSEERTMLEKLDPQIPERQYRGTPKSNGNSELILGAGLLFVLFMLNR